MGVQLIIDGHHITDVLNQVIVLADIVEKDSGTVITAETQPKKIKDVVLPKDKELADSVDPEEEVTAGGVIEVKPKIAPKNLSTKEQKEAVKEMIDAGQKDDRYDRLNNTNQKRVDAALQKIEADDNSVDSPVEPEQTEIEDAIEKTNESQGDNIDIDKIRDKMAELGKDENGDDNRENLTKIRDILVSFIPEGERVMISNIPSDKMVEFYNKIGELS